MTEIVLGYAAAGMVFFAICLYFTRRERRESIERLARRQAERQALDQERQAPDQTQTQTERRPA